MEKIIRWIIVVLFLLVVVAVLYAASGQAGTYSTLKGYSRGTYRQQGPNSQASYEEGSFGMLGDVHAKQGDTISFELANPDDETQYFAVYDYNIDEKIPAHKVGFVKFTATKRGEFWFGGREKGQVGKLVVD